MARQAIGFDVGGLAKLNAAAEQAATAPWLKRFNENGVKVVRVFKMKGNGRVGGSRRRRSSRTACSSADAGEYRARTAWWVCAQG